jgi:hypothetical protein
LPCPTATKLEQFIASGILALNNPVIALFDNGLEFWILKLQYEYEE